MAASSLPAPPGIFITAQWRHLVMLNYEVPPAVLAPYLPAGTSLDFWNGKTYVSLVGFLFVDTRVLGIPIPFHRDFEELNLRFYVRREDARGVQRGVGFIKEVVPRQAIATVARVAYNENYVALPMRHRFTPALPVSPGTVVEYGWKLRGRWGALSVRATGPAALGGAGSVEEFITEHYWGYAAQRDGGTEFAEVLRGPPSSALLAEGSLIVVRRGVRLSDVRQ